MTDFLLPIATIGVCMLWVAWRDHAKGNKRDSVLLAGLGVSTVVSSVGLLVISS
jgi:hypothetical protein